MKAPILAPLAAALFLALPAPFALAETLQPGAHFIENWDLDGDGKVSLADATERRDDIFTTFDADEDETLSPAEYDDFDAARAADMAQNQEGHGGKGMGGNMGGYERSMSREVSDGNGDGIVTRAEFVDGTPGWFKMRDRDADAFITPADFGPPRK